MKPICILVFAWIALALAACSAGGTPRLIASFPTGSQPDQIPPQAYPPTPAQLVYNAHLVLGVSDPRRAAERAESLAYEYDGYLLSSHAWVQDGREQVSVVLAVPLVNFDGLRAGLARLGDLQSEKVWGEWISHAPGGAPNYSQVTVQFQPKTFQVLRWPLTGWDPGRTFRRAIGVSVTIFGFIGDILIWLLVVIGPFILLGWAAYVLALRLRRKS